MVSLKEFIENTGTHLPLKSVVYCVVELDPPNRHHKDLINLTIAESIKLEADDMFVFIRTKSNQILPTVVQEKMCDAMARGVKIRTVRSSGAIVEQLKAEKYTRLYIVSRETLPEAKEFNTITEGLFEEARVINSNITPKSGVINRMDAINAVKRGARGDFRVATGWTVSTADTIYNAVREALNE